MRIPSSVIITVPYQTYQSFDEVGLKLRELAFTNCPLDYNIESVKQDDSDFIITYILNYQDVYNSEHLYEQVSRYNPANLSDSILIQYHQLVVMMISELFSEVVSIDNFIENYYCEYDDHVMTLTEEIFNEVIPLDVMNWVYCFIDESFNIAIAEFQRLTSINETYRIIIDDMDTMFKHKAILKYHPEKYTD